MAIKSEDGNQSTENGWNIDHEKRSRQSAKHIRVKPVQSALEKFLKLAWRTPGQYGYIVTRDPATNAFEQYPIEIGDDNNRRLREHVRSDLDVYFACAEFNTADNRKGANAHALNGFHVDLDCGDDKAASGKGYTDWKAAKDAVYAFCEKAYLPKPNVMIKSGGGVHCYWHIATGLDPSAWKAYAVKFKGIAAALNFLADPSRTADVASLMRAPGTSNHKYDPPRPVEILEFSDKLIANDEMLAAIDKAWADHVPHVAQEVERTEETESSPNSKKSGQNMSHGAHSIEQLSAMLKHIDPDSGYGDWCSVLMAIHHETGGSDMGLELADAWSSKGHKYAGRHEIETKWSSFANYEGNPVTVGTIRKMITDQGLDWIAICAATEPGFEKTSTTRVEGTTTADTEEGFASNVDADTKATTPHPLVQFSLTGTSDQLKAEALAQVFVLQDIGLSGQFLVIYAKHNTGKTLIVLKLLIDSIQAGRVQSENLFYLNLDDTHAGLTTKTVLAEQYGFHMLCDGYNGFDVSIFRTTILELIDTGRAKGSIIVLDTLKKFTDTMDKRKASAFMKLMRQFIAKGGTIIALAHVNKNPGADGLPVYSGTTDIVDDADCAYVVDTAGSDDVALTRTVQFRNIKRRGNVLNQVAFRYSIADGQTYEQLLTSVENVDHAELSSTKQAEIVKSDTPIIEAITTSIRQGITAKMALKAAVAEKAEISQYHALQVIDRYTGDDPARDRWNYTVGARGAKTFSLLEVANGK